MVQRTKPFVTVEQCPKLGRPCILVGWERDNHQYFGYKNARTTHQLILTWIDWGLSSEYTRPTMDWPCDVDGFSAARMVPSDVIIIAVASWEIPELNGQLNILNEQWLEIGGSWIKPGLNTWGLPLLLQIPIFLAINYGYTQVSDTPRWK